MGSLRLFDELVEVLTGPQDICLAEDAVDDGQHIGAGRDQWAAIFRGYTPDGNNGYIQCGPGSFQQTEFRLNCLAR